MADRKTRTGIFVMFAGGRIDAARRVRGVFHFPTYDDTIVRDDSPCGEDDEEESVKNMEMLIGLQPCRDAQHHSTCLDDSVNLVCKNELGNVTINFIVVCFYGSRYVRQ